MEYKDYPEVLGASSAATQDQIRRSQKIRPGDSVAVHDQGLRIDRLGVRTTYGTTAKDGEIMIPNATGSKTAVFGPDEKTTGTGIQLTATQ